jgi:hypothetical protein
VALVRSVLETLNPHPRFPNKKVPVHRGVFGTEFGVLRWYKHLKLSYNVLDIDIIPEPGILLLLSSGPWTPDSTVYNPLPK